MAYVAGIAMFVVGASGAHGQGWQFGGHAKYQYRYTDYRADDIQAVLGHTPAQDQGVDLRLKADYQDARWDAALHYELLGIHGDALEAQRQLSTFGLTGRASATGLPDDRRQLFDLTDTLVDGRRTAAVHRLDRLALGYHDSARTVRAGRQAVSWGNGLAFQVLDFVDPFAPTAIDKDYKNGEDMLYGQWALPAQSDAQFMLVPRRDPQTRQVEDGESSYAAKWRRRVAGVDVDVLAARNHDEYVGGVGVVRSVGGAVGRLDASLTGLQDGSRSWSVVTNLDYSWVWATKNWYGYAEYFRNGVGETTTAGYVAPNAELAARLARGEVYTLARDYAALGLQLEVTPLLNTFANLIYNLNDTSSYLQLRGVYDWAQNTQLMLGANLPHGERGEEYGGIPVGATGTWLGYGRAVYARLAQYF
jgi:hypothetical protein